MRVLIIGTGLLASAICKLYKLRGKKVKFDLSVASRSPNRARHILQDIVI